MLFWLFLFGLLLYFLLRKPKNTDVSPTVSQNSLNIADRLEALADDPSYSRESLTYKEIALALRENRLPKPVSGSAGGTVNSEELKVDPAAIAQQKRADLEAQKSADLGELLSNVNSLLFAGAFLIVVSAGILIGSNLEYIPNGARVAMLAMFAAIFYLSGIAIYQKPKLRPAGATFTGVGLVLLPLTGLAAQSLLFEEAARWPVFMITSLITLAAGLFTSKFIKHAAVQYLTVSAGLLAVQFTLLSSGIEYVYLAWSLLISSVVMVRLSQRAGAAEFSESLHLLSQITVPIAYLFGLVQGAEIQQWWQLSVSSIFASIFYQQVSTIVKESDQKLVLQSISLLLLPISCVIALFEIKDVSIDLAVLSGLVMASWSIIYTVVALSSHVQLKKFVLPSVWPQVTAVLSVVAFFLLFGNMEVLLGARAVMVFQHFFLYASFRDPTSLFVSLAAGLLLPVVGWVGVGGLEHTWQHAALSASYFVLAWFYVASARGFLGGSFTERGREMLEGALLLSFAASAFSVIDAPNQIQVFMWMVIALSFVQVGRLYGRAEFLYITQLLTFFALYAFVGLFDNIDFDLQLFVSSLGVASLSLFGSYALAGTWQQVVRRGAIMAAVVSIFNGENSYSNTGLYAASLACMVEYFQAKNKTAGYFSAALMIAALERTLFLATDIREAQAYIIPWGLFALWLASIQSRKGNNEVRDSWTIVGLMILSLPLLLQLSSEPTIGHFALALVESAVMMIQGVSMRYKLPVWWGVGMILFVTFDRVVGVVSTIPNYVISALAGVGLLLAAIYFLQRHNDL